MFKPTVQDKFKQTAQYTNFKVRDVAIAIQKLRMAHGFTLNDLAEASGLPYKWLLGLEALRYKPAERHIFSLARHFGFANIAEMMAAADLIAAPVLVNAATLGPAIAIVREDLGLSQDALATQLGICSPTLARLEYGSAIRDEEILDKAPVLLGCKTRQEVVDRAKALRPHTVDRPSLER